MDETLTSGMTGYQLTTWAMAGPTLTTGKLHRPVVSTDMSVGGIPLASWCLHFFE